MPIKKTNLKTEAGVRLDLIEKISAHGKVLNQHYRLSTMRPNQPRIMVARIEAEDAYDLEVIASLMDPIIQKLTTRH